MLPFVYFWEDASGCCPERLGKPKRAAGIAQTPGQKETQGARPEDANSRLVGMSNQVPAAVEHEFGPPAISDLFIL